MRNTICTATEQQELSQLAYDLQMTMRASRGENIMDQLQKTAAAVERILRVLASR